MAGLCSRGGGVLFIISEGATLQTREVATNKKTGYITEEALSDALPFSVMTRLIPNPQTHQVHYFPFSTILLTVYR